MAKDQDEHASGLIERFRHVRKRGSFSRGEFLAMCEWKSPRTKGRCSGNRKSRVRTVSRAVYRTADEDKRMTLLTSLEGVGIPTASAVLTLTDPTRYGVIDIRAWQVLYSVGAVSVRRSGQGFRLADWLNYLAILRREARALKVTPRRVDLTLFRYHQRHHEGPLYRDRG